MTFGERLKYERGQASLTQEEVSQQLCVSRQTISSWENERSYPDIQNLVALSDLYHLSLDVLLREDDVIMEQMETEQQIVKNSQKIVRISYYANLLLVILVISSRFVAYPTFLEKSITGLFILNLLVFVLFKQVNRTQQLNKKSLLKGLGLSILVLLLLPIFAHQQHLSAYAAGYNTGSILFSLLEALGVVCLFFPTRQKQQ